ncbi:MAG: hypothetical protein KDA69_06110 [Planctomycetaceae bacterium]|nr:hypothetical protein [Planctomycetaceae bacterium]
MTTETPPSDQLSDVQQRLMDMLGSVELDAARSRRPSAPIAPEPTPVPATNATQSRAPQAQPGRKPGPNDCPNCAAPEPFAKSSWCGSCGFYPQLNRCIDIDSGLPEVEQEITAVEAFERMPAWLWTMLAGCLAIVFYSVLLRILIPVIDIRGPLGLMHVVGGLCTVIFVHVRAFVLALKTSEKVTLATMFVKPVETWQPVARQLPESRKLFYALAWGATAFVVGLGVLNVHWDAIFRPTPQQRKERFNPLKWVMKAAVFIVNNSQQGEGGESGTGPVQDAGPSMMAEVMATAQELKVNQDVGPEPGNFEEALEGFAGKATENVLGDVNELAEHGVESQYQQEADDQVEAMTHEQAIEESRRRDEEREAEIAADEEAKRNKESKPGEEESNSKGGSSKTPANDGKSTANDKPTTSGDQKPLLGGGSTKTTPAAPTAKKSEYVIFGYTLNILGDMHSVVIAEMVGDARIRYVGTVSVSGLSAEKRAELQESLDKVRTEKPLIRVPFGGRWARPTYMCTVSYSEKSSRGQLEDAEIVSFHKR